MKQTLTFPPFSNPIKTLFFLLIISSIASSGSSNQHEIATHASILNSSCSTTLYPNLCFSQLSTHPHASTQLKSAKDVIRLALNVTQASVQRTFSKISNVASSRTNFTLRETTALKDCLEMLNTTLEEVNMVVNEFNQYPSSNISIAEQAEELNILLSAAMTNQQTCIDGFSHDKGDKKVRELIMDDEMNVLRLCSNALALIKNMTDTDIAREENSKSFSRKMLEEKNRMGWPKWLSAGDRRLLQATTVTPNVVVAADGSGNYRTVSEAVAAAPDRSSSRYVIKIKAGVYRENVDVSSRKTNIMFVGDGSTTTIITASRNVVDGSTTFNSATVAAVGDMFLARDITFQNSAGPSKHQAVALRVGSDRSAFYRCSMIAYQDTLYVHSLRQFYTSCIIIGSVDFIFGNAAAVFQNCDIHARRPNPGQKNMVTAQGRDDPNQNTGIVIQKCRIGATKDLQAVQSSFPTYLGRPWKLYSRTVIMQSEISDVINPAGWFEWNGNFALDTLVYREYKNTGPGSSTANRVTWKGFKVMSSDAEAEVYTAENFIVGSSWLPSTGFPFSLGL
ncbi:Plant invertase/pectin methylesterase inhibitor superfamily [Euphorbia peplus]|nr:Plant invertase/pectin methylesterase inhibitor superfamily [Euphorbia peplus]